MPSDAAIVKKVIAQLDKEPVNRMFIVNHSTPAEMADIAEMLFALENIGMRPLWCSCVNAQL